MTAERTIEIPESVFFSAQTLDELEDWLLSNDPSFLDRMRAIRDREDRKGAGKELPEILKRWPTES